MVLVQRRAQGGADALGEGQVLHRVGQAVHPASVVTTGEFGVALVGFGQQQLGRLQADQGVDPGVEALDVLQVVLHHLAAGHLALADAQGKLVGRQLHQLTDGLVLAHGSALCERRVAGDPAR
ncbi:hypothetical protein D3C72_2011700 [compost metagenome]